VYTNWLKVLLRSINGLLVWNVHEYIDSTISIIKAALPAQHPIRMRSNDKIGDNMHTCIIPMYLVLISPLL